MSPPISRSAPVDADLSPVRERAEAVLRELVGRGDARLRDDQWSAIRALVVDRRRALVVERTGWGKSAVYFVATVLLREGRAPAAAPDTVSSSRRTPFFSVAQRVSSAGCFKVTR